MGSDICDQSHRSILSVIAAIELPASSSSIAEFRIRYRMPGEGEVEDEREDTEADDVGGEG